MKNKTENVRGIASKISTGIENLVLSDFRFVSLDFHKWTYKWRVTLGKRIDYIILQLKSYFEIKLNVTQTALTNDMISMNICEGSLAVKAYQ